MIMSTAASAEKRMVEVGMSKRTPMATSRMATSTAASSKMCSAVSIRSSKEDRQVAFVLSASSFWRRAVAWEKGLSLMKVQYFLDVDEMGRVKAADAGAEDAGEQG